MNNDFVVWIYSMNNEWCFFIGNNRESIGSQNLRNAGWLPTFNYKPNIQLVHEKHTNTRYRHNVLYVELKINLALLDYENDQLVFKMYWHSVCCFIVELYMEVILCIELCSQRILMEVHSTCQLVPNKRNKTAKISFQGWLRCGVCQWPAEVCWELALLIWLRACTGRMDSLSVSASPLPPRYTHIHTLWQVLHCALPIKRGVYCV